MRQDKQEIHVLGESVTIDTAVFDFNDQTLPNYLQKEAGHYAYYGAMLANAEAEEQWALVQYEQLFDTTYIEAKNNGMGSDKFCESWARSRAEVVDLRQKQIAAKRNVSLLKTFLRAFDKNHDNAQSTGHNLRKEMDKLGQSGERLFVSDEEKINEMFREM